MIEGNRTLLHKADLKLADLIADGGFLVEAQAAKFIRLLIDEAVVLKQATVVPMKSHKQLVDKIRFKSRILRPGSEAVALAQADRAKPDLSQVTLDVELFKAEVRLNNETLEDNLERDSLQQTVMQLMGEAISRDMDEIVVNGDTASADLFLKKFDGILKQATSNLVDNLTAPLTTTTLKKMLKTMPSEFLRTKKSMRFYTSVDADIDYRDSLISRDTAVGDKFLERDVPGSYSGVPINPVPLFPEGLGGGQNETNVLLTDPKNINIGIWRNIMMETDKDITAGEMIIVVTVRFDTKLAEETAVVKAEKVTVS